MPDTARPKLLAFVSDVSARTQVILPNQAHIESLPFDGIVVNIPASWSQMSPGSIITEAGVREWLEPLKAYNVGKHNYLAMEMDKPGDLFDDAAWAQVAANWRVIGKVAAETGFKGILFDNEEYAGKWQNFPEDYTEAQLQRGLKAYEDMASLRGKQLMAALAETMPNAEVAIAHGPYLSVPTTVNTPKVFELQGGDKSNNELRGPFFTGFLEGMGPNQHLIDGGELYALRTAAEFKQSFDFRNTTMAGLVDWKVDPKALANWSTLVDQSHIVYTGTFPEGYTQTPESVVTSLLNAFDNSERVVFLYSEKELVELLTPGATSSVWIASVARAVELADHTMRGTYLKETLTGTAFMDRIYGNGGKDFIRGGAGNDMIYGGARSDTIVGGVGKDVLEGGLGADRFRYSDVKHGGDVIVDFGSNDYMTFRGAAFGNIKRGALDKSLFWSSADGLAHDATDRFIYNTTDHSVWYDADGAGKAAPVLMATFENAFALTAGDILIF